MAEREVAIIATQQTIDATEATVVETKRRIASGEQGAVVSGDQLTHIHTQVACVDTVLQGARKALLREDVRVALPEIAKNSIDVGRVRREPFERGQSS